MIATTVTKKAAVDIFSYPQHAKFLAAAASASSIPKLHGVPEVSLGQEFMRPRFTDNFIRSLSLDAQTSENRLS